MNHILDLAHCNLTMICFLTECIISLKSKCFHERFLFKLLCKVFVICVHFTLEYAFREVQENWKG